MIFMPKIDWCCWIYDRSKIFLSLSFSFASSLSLIVYTLSKRKIELLAILFLYLSHLFNSVHGNIVCSNYQKTLLFLLFLELTPFFSTNHRQIMKYEYKKPVSFYVLLCSLFTYVSYFAGLITI